jgi:hypothetical protein
MWTRLLVSHAVGGGWEIRKSEDGKVIASVESRDEAEVLATHAVACMGGGEVSIEVAVQAALSLAAESLRERETSAAHAPPAVRHPG